MTEWTVALEAKPTAAMRRAINQAQITAPMNTTNNEPAQTRAIMNSNRPRAASAVGSGGVTGV